MHIFSQAWQYVLSNPDHVRQTILVHFLLSGAALMAAALFAIPLGILASRRPALAGPALASINTVRVIPSLAVLAFMLPILGSGFFPAWLALTLLAIPPILINTSLGFRQVPEDMLEAAGGMGMGVRHILFKIEFPYALPSILAGLRTSAVEVVGGATLAAFIGAGGLGVFIINGLSMYAFPLLLVGAVPVALLALMMEMCFAVLEGLVAKILPC